MGKEGSYGYKNEKGVYIKVQEDKKGETHIGIYDKRPDDPDHVSIHINVDSDSKNYTLNDNTSGKNDHSSGGCFITTACIKHMKKKFDDNCYELNILRWFRDNFVSNEDIKHYYTLAPIIVEEIDKLEDCDKIYQKIYDEMIDICVKQIQNDDYKSAYKLYKKCILELEEKYARSVLNQRLINVLKKKRDLMYVKEVCCNGDQVVKSFSEENTQENEFVYRLVPNTSNGIEVKVSNKNIENNSRFVATLFD